MITFFESDHGPLPSWLPQEVSNRIEKPMVPPHSYKDFKMGSVFSIHVSHPEVNFVIHPSHGFRQSMYKGFAADWVFMGIGSLGQQSQAYLDEYYDEVVSTLGSSTLVPIHWDNFSTSNSDGLKPMPEVIGGFSKVMEFLLEKGLKTGRRTILLDAWEEIDLSANKTEGTT